MNRSFTGRHMALILVAGFGVVIAVNLVMARLAVSTFGGVVVENSYVASQNFNRWLDQAERSKALGWTAQVVRSEGDRVLVTFAKADPAPQTLVAVARHPLGRLPDVRLEFERGADGGFVSTAALPAGRWVLRMEATAGEHLWRGEQPLQ